MLLWWGTGYFKVHLLLRVTVIGVWDPSVPLVLIFNFIASFKGTTTGSCSLAGWGRNFFKIDCKGYSFISLLLCFCVLFPVFFITRAQIKVVKGRNSSLKRRIWSTKPTGETQQGTRRRCVRYEFCTRLNRDNLTDNLNMTLFVVCEQWTY